VREIRPFLYSLIHRERERERERGRMGALFSALMSW
jgi:hypothetical protein